MKAHNSLLPFALQMERWERDGGGAVGGGKEEVKEGRREGGRRATRVTDGEQ